MRIAILEASHWHMPLLAQGLEGAQVVAISETGPDARDRIAGTFGARAYADAATLLAREQLDFAFVFGAHDMQTELALRVIERGLPCSIEKPGGLHAGDIERLIAAAQNRFVAVAMVQRVGPLFGELVRLRDREGARFAHASFRFFAGPPQRYRTAGTPWMLDPVRAGGGCLMNLAPHFIDLALTVIPGPLAVQGASCTAHVHAEDVEDVAQILLAGPHGTAMVQTGYCFPEHPRKREYTFSLVSPTHHVSSTPEGIAIHATGGRSRSLVLDLDSDPLYGVYARRCLHDAAAGLPPVAGLRELLAAMHVVDAAYAVVREAS